MTFFTSPLLAQLPHLHHGFFTRSGGVSTGNRASLNCKEDVFDSIENVLENRRRVVKALQGNVWVGLTQKHTPQVFFITEPSRESLIGDALITKTPGLVLSVITADCVPILLSDKEEAIVAAIHAGWRGTFAGVIENTLTLMREKGAENIVACLGPSIQKQSYEVGGEFIDYFNEYHLLEEIDCTAFLTPNAQNKNSYLFDLPMLVTHVLASNGVESIDRINKDTYTSPDLFFSYRRKTHLKEEGMGCQTSSIVIKEAKGDIV